MPAIAIGSAVNARIRNAEIAETAEKSLAFTSSKTVHVFADARHDQPAAVDALQNRGDVQCDEPDPGEDEHQAQHAAEPERREADEAHHHDVGEQYQELGDHQHHAVLRVPLHLGVVFFEEQRDERKRPQIREHDHHAAIRRRRRIGHAGGVYDILDPMQVEQAVVLEALKIVRDPDLNRDIVSLGFVKDLKIDGGRVSFTIELTTPACPVKDQMRDQSRAAVMQLPGVSAVDVQMSARVREAVGADGGRQPLPGVKNVIAVGAGKGGVGKTTVAVNLAVALAKCGGKVGIIENMSYFACPSCHHEADIFGHGGGETMAAELGVPFVGRIPIYQPIREGSDVGVPLMISEPDSPAARAFMSAAERIAAQVSIASYNRPTIPLTVVR